MNQKTTFLILGLVIVLGAITYFFVAKDIPVPATSPTTNQPSQQPTSNNPIKPNVAAAIETIKTGTSFGECVGYCKTEVVINSKNIIYIRSSWDNSKPEVKQEIPISADKWNALVNALDVKKFAILPEVIGCPDCADGGAEWVEVFNEKTTKKVTFEYGASVSGIDSLVKILREIRKDVSSRFDKQ